MYVCSCRLHTCKKERRAEIRQIIQINTDYKRRPTMKKVIDEIKKHKKAMIGVAVIVVIFAWVLIANEPAPTVE